MMNDREDG
jgi:hypothetical protein